MNNAAAASEMWRPFLRLGFTHPFFDIDLHLVLYTWIVIGMLICFALAIRCVLANNTSIFRRAALFMVESLMSLTEQALGQLQFNHFAFIGSLFIFIFLCNILSLFPWLEEPTRDINTTLSLALISFLYKEYFTFKTHGLLGYIKTYCEPFAIMIPLALLGRLATVLSLSFRLFGNISGGAIIMQMYFYAAESWAVFEGIGLFSGLHFIIILFFGLFEGFIQAFVFTMLSLTYLSIALQPEEEEGHGHALEQHKEYAHD